LHDAIRLENLGIPTISVATDEFTTAARAQGSALGRPDYDPVFVPHPIQDQTSAEIEKKAGDAIDEITRKLTS
jgi:hypothetical protein